MPPNTESLGQAVRYLSGMADQEDTKGRGQALWQGLLTVRSLHERGLALAKSPMKYHLGKEAGKKGFRVRV